MFVIREDDLNNRQTRELLALHLSGMHENSPPDAVFALDLTGLLAPEVTVWSAWRTVGYGQVEIASIGALKMLRDGSAEVKSMGTHPDYLRQGAAAAILDKIIEVARGRGVTRLSLETGRGAAFEPALAMYRRPGFADGGPFWDYEPNAFSQFLHMEL